MYKYKVHKFNVNSKGSIARSKMKEVELDYIDFSAYGNSDVYFAVKTRTDYTSVNLTLKEAIELQAQLTQAIKVSKDHVVKLALENSA